MLYGRGWVVQKGLNAPENSPRYTNKRALHIPAASGMLGRCRMEEADPTSSRPAIFCARDTSTFAAVSRKTAPCITTYEHEIHFESQGVLGLDS